MNKEDNTKAIVYPKFCGIEGIILVASAEEDKKRRVCILQEIDAEEHEYDAYCMDYSRKTGNISIIKYSEEGLVNMVRHLLKENNVGKVEIRDAYFEKDDLKSFFKSFESMNCPIDSIFITMRSILGFDDIKTDVNENDSADDNAEKKDDDNDKKSDEKKDNNTKQPTEKHAKAVHKIADAIIEDKNAFLQLVRLFAYIEKHGQDAGYAKTLTNILNAIKKK